MAPLASKWWTEGRIEATVTHGYVLKQLDPNFHSRLRGPIAFGEGLTDDTYIDWILQRARKIFLILVDIGAPERIFSLVDETYDDSDLPIDSKNAELLRVSPHREDVFLNWKFINAQARFLVGDILADQHISFEGEEPIPLEVVGQRPPTVSLPETHLVDRVVLSGPEVTEHLRFRVQVHENSQQLGGECDVVREVQSLLRYRHEHCVSIYASYFADNTVNVLFTGVPEFSLRTFLNEKTQLPKKLSKCDQRLQWVNWPNCLANALAWLHSQDQIHGAVRPSNIMIDPNNQIFLGFFDRYNTLVGRRKEDRSEIYQYSSPEQWVGRPLPVVQTQVIPSSPFAAIYPTAGSHVVKSAPTTTSKPPPPPPPPKQENNTWTSKLYNSISVTEVPRAQSTSSSVSNGTSSSTGSSPGNTITPSNLHSGPTKGQARTVYASDVFSLAAITLDIITHLCKRRQSAFIQHRGTVIKNKSTTRPTRLSESAFHLHRNAGQILSWIDILDVDASKGNDAAFHAVKPMLMEVKNMLSQDPDLRPTASQVSDKFFRAINQIDFGATQPHCKTLQAPGTITATPLPTIESTKAVNNHKHISSSTKHSSVNTPHSSVYSNNSSNISHVDEPSTPSSYPRDASSPTLVDTSKPWPGRPQRQQSHNDSTADLIDEMIEDFHFRDVRKGSLPSISSWPSPGPQPQQPLPEIPQHQYQHQHQQQYQQQQVQRPQAENRLLNQRLRHSEESDASGLAEMIPQFPGPRRLNTVSHSSCDRTYSNSSSGSSRSANSREAPVDGKIPMKKRAFFNFSRNKSLAGNNNNTRPS